MVRYFPHQSVREGQEDFLSDCEESFGKGGLLVAHAPTGIGKTAAVLSAAVGQAVKNQKTVFFLTPKHTQHTIVVDTLKRITERHKLPLCLVDIIGKQWMCPHMVRDLTSREFNEFCRTQKKDELCECYNNTKRAKTTKRAQDAIARIIAKPLHNEEVLTLCAKDKLCPYEVLLEAGRKADVVVCDYFHLFSPSVRNAFLNKLGKGLEDSILIVDEAHNLPDRIRGIMSHKLGTFSLERASKEASVLNFRELSEDLKGLSKALKRMARKVGVGQERYVERAELLKQITLTVKRDYKEFVDDVEALGAQVLRIPGRYRSYSSSVATFLQEWDGQDIGYARIMDRDEHNINVSRKCLDPSLFCAEVFERSYSSVLMSGTLTPLHMYSNILGLQQERIMERAYKSPFPPENRLSILVPGLTTKYAARTEYMYQKYAKTISSLIGLVPGNVAAFFPSYGMLGDIAHRLRTSKEKILERQEMDKEERIRLISRLGKVRRAGGGVLLAVQAGSFSEGLDYADNLLDAVIIVGLPLERPNLENQALIDYYDFKFERGWDFGYIFPAMNRALQAAGRCIRSETDRGAIILLDERFKWGNYRKCFPSDFEFIVSETPEKYLTRFFAGKAFSEEGDFVY